MPKNFAATRPVNPLGAEPKLTMEQLWAGLQKKARDPKDFIVNVASVSILEDSADKVVREVIFRNEAGDIKFTEYISFNEPANIIFHAPEQGVCVTNLISFDRDNNLQLTFSFIGGVPGQDPGPNVSVEELSQKVGVIIEKSIAKTRELVKEGLL